MADKAQKAKGGLRTSTCADESYMSCRGGTAVSESLYGVATYKSDQPLSGISPLSPHKPSVGVSTN
jgi:hypothetical protein